VNVNIEMVKQIHKRHFAKAFPDAEVFIPVIENVAAGEYDVFVQGNFTAVLLLMKRAFPARETTFIGMSKRDTRDSPNQKLGEMTALGRAIHSALRTGLKALTIQKSIPLPPGVIAPTKTNGAEAVVRNEAHAHLL
jgi:hypothetical protein